MTGNAATADRAGKAGRLKRALGAALAILIAVPVLFAAGFLWFVWRMPSEEVALDRSADGIVVLTGGASRILDGIELLAAGRGKRLLISGVHRGGNQALGQEPGLSLADRRHVELSHAAHHGGARLANARRRADPVSGDQREDAQRAVVDRGLDAAAVLRIPEIPRRPGPHAARARIRLDGFRR